MTSWKALPFILVRRSKSLNVDRLSCSRWTSLPKHQFSHRSHNSQNSKNCHISMLEQCLDLSIRLSSSVTKDSIHISELFRHEEWPSALRRRSSYRKVPGSIPRLRASDETIEFFRFSYRVGETRA